MSALENLLRWAHTAGIELNGIAPQAYPGKGTGIIATRLINPQDVVLEAPTTAILCLDTISPLLRASLERAANSIHGSRISLQGLLAAALINPQENRRRKSVGDDIAFDLNVWAACAPPTEPFITSFPLGWPQALQDLVPAGIKTLLNRQKIKFEADWAATSSIFFPNDIDRPRDDLFDKSEDPNRRWYLYAWLLINSRTFYNDTPSTEKYPWDERLTLIPVADLFNHTPSPGTINSPRRAPVSVSFSEHEYTFTANKAIAPGEEVCISYGEHSNDFLLAEYGFFFTSGDQEGKHSDGDHNGSNPHDSICLDEVILPRLSPEQRSQLLQLQKQIRKDDDDDDDDDGSCDDRERDSIGDYAVSLAKHVDDKRVLLLSPRMQMAVTVLLGRHASPITPAIGTWDSEWTSDRTTVDLIRTLLKDMQEVVSKRLLALRSIDNVPYAPKASLIERWKQIGTTAALGVEFLKTPRSYPE